MREFWIYQLARDYITERFEDVAKWKQSFIDDDILYPPEIIHVIERAPAYAAAYHARSGLLAALSVLDKRSPAYSDCEAGLIALKAVWGAESEWPEPK